MQIKHIATIAMLTLISLSSAYAANNQRGFAIVVDQQSLNEAKTEIQAYAEAVEEINGLKTFIVVDRWGIPDSIRAELQRLHEQKSNPIEGAILLGDIPVAMIRDAQHQTSAFKMNQIRDRKESSVPSDRYYDDFGLKFDFIGKDDDAPYYYYSLRSDSRQWLSSHIYIGRVRPSDVNGTSRYDKLRTFLRKAVAEKRQQNPIDHILYFSGHGYISDSMTARIDEKQGLYEHFPWLHQQQNGIEYIDHKQEDYVKFKVMNELMRPDMDYALMHHHGAPETEYFDDMINVDSPDKAKKLIIDYCHNYLHAAEHHGMDIDSVMTVLEKRFDIPRSWLADTFDPEVVKRDSLESLKYDLNLQDFQDYNFRPNCRVMMLDACFNGSFHLDDCIANEYIFSEGRTVAAIANTVNVLQDKWSDRYIGLLGIGMNVGYIPVYSGYLESQCIGDPTYTFTPARQVVDINALLAAPQGNQALKTWKKLLGNSMPDVQCMAIEQLHRAHAISSKELLDLFKSTPYAIVRVQALTSLADLNDDNFVEAIRLGVTDSYELVQRFALRYLSMNGDPRLIPALISVCISNNTSERCNFNAMNALSVYPEKALMEEFERQFDSPDVHYINKDTVRAQIAYAICASADKWEKNMDQVVAADTPKETRKLAIRTTRNYCQYFRIPEMMDYLRQTDDAEIQVMILESFGWNAHCYLRPDIEAFTLAVSNDDSFSTEVRNEALKTYNRLHR